jgi:hypothetical protein
MNGTVDKSKSPWLYSVMSESGSSQYSGASNGSAIYMEHLSAVTMERMSIASRKLYKNNKNPVTVEDDDKSPSAFPNFLHLANSHSKTSTKLSA